MPTYAGRWPAGRPKINGEREDDYSPEEFGLSNSTIRRAYKAYLDEFGDYC